MKHRLLLSTLAGTGLLLAAGCVPLSESAQSATQTVVTGHEGGAYAPKNTTKYDLENEAKFVLLDHDVQRSVTCSGLQERFTDDGRLEVRGQRAQPPEPAHPSADQLHFQGCSRVSRRMKRLSPT